MADASRFPHLAPPFAIVGAAAGWLSAGLVMHPILRAADPRPRIVAALVAMIFGAATGLLLRRWCVGRRYDYQFEAPDPDTRTDSDTWWRHGPALLLAGIATGIIVATVSESFFPPLLGGFGGFLCTLPFLPICGAVLAAARRAQRARHGSLVAASDRRAVWGILAITLAAATLEGLPDWAAPSGGTLLGPELVLGVLLAASACILVVLIADVLAWRRARRALSVALLQRDPGETSPEDAAVPRLDLGLGNDLHAHLFRTGSAYRGHDQTLALVQGDLDQARRALRRAIGRGIAGLALAAGVLAAHRAADGNEAHVFYEQRRCELGHAESCGMAADYGRRAGEPDHASAQRAILLYEKGCNRHDPASCAALADIYRGNAGVDRDVALVTYFEYRTAKTAFCSNTTSDQLRAPPGTTNESCL